MLRKNLLFAGILFLFFTGLLHAQDCSLPYLPADFKARLAWRSTQDGASALATPVVANMNPQQDSMPEIIIGEGRAGNNVANSILFFRGDGSNANNPMVLTVPGGFDNYPVPGPTVGDIDGDGRPELIMSCFDGRIRVFNNYTETPAAPMTLWITSAPGLDFVDQRPYLADFDGDGISEVYTGSDVYKFDFSNPAAPALVKVINGPAFKGLSVFSPSTEGACNPTAVDMLTVADCNGDPDCAGLELVAGPVIYSIDLDLTDGDGYEIKVKRNLNSMVSSNIQYTDGYTAVADVNLDGTLDIVVTGRRTPNTQCVYVWNKNGLIRNLSYPQVTNQSGSLACIANVYDDTKNGAAEDFPEIMICSSFNFTCFNLNAAQANPAAPYWWNLPTTDYSGWTGATVYDFNGDGFSEIVYRDEEDLRILYGGGAPFPAGVDAERNWHKVPCYSITSDEYAVVADVDNDGETEIAVAGRLAQSVSNSKGRLHVFESDSGPWIPSRNLWNQYNYFVVNVNDDLSIPDQQDFHHLELPAPGSGNRPLNRYLSQRPLLDENFQPAFPLPDATAQVAQIQCAADSLTIALNVCNNGKKALDSGTSISFYQSDPTSTNAALLGVVQITPAAVEKDSCHLFYYTIPKIAGTVFGVLNDDGTKPRPFQLVSTDPLSTQLECDWLNNIFQFEPPTPGPAVDLGPDLSSCHDTILMLHAGAGYASYEWQDGSTDTVFQVQQPGVYWVETTDFCANKHLDSLQVVLLEAPAIQLDTVNGNCHGLPAGVNAAASGPYQPFSYLWSTSDTNPSLSGLNDGLYTVTITNAKGCTATRTTWVEAGGNLEVTAAVAAPISCFGENGALQLDFTAGQPPYLFNWSDGHTVQNLPSVPAGDYAVTVTDADLCTETLQIALPQPEPLVSAGLIATPTCPGMSSGEISFAGAAQGTPPYGLYWSNNGSGNQLTNLSAGTYQLTISDANGCSLVESTQVPLYAAPLATPSLSDVSCFGANDGSIALAVSGGAPGISFSWSNSANTPDIHNLTPGNYALTLTYANGACAQNFDFQIAEPPPLLLSAAATPAGCNNNLGGSIDLTVQNGVAPLGFLWSNNATSEDLSNLTGGTYLVTVSDAGGCSKTYSQVVAQLPAIALSATTQEPLCAGSANGSIQLNASGGTGAMQFQWSNNASGTSVSGLQAGSYTITATDAAACTALLSVNLNAPLPLGTLGVSTLPSCPGEPNGEATFLGAKQGTPPYNLLWSTGATAPTLTLPAGQYNYTVTDAHGCTVSAVVKIISFFSPMTYADVTDVSCFGQQNGSISVGILSGSPGFEYLWSNNQNTPDISNLGPGAYNLTLTYADGKCHKNLTYQITEPSQLTLLDTLVTPVRCFSESSGAIALSAEGGIPGYTYHWSNGAQTEDLGNLAAGTYPMTLTDANGCVLSTQFVVPQPAELSISAVVAADTCETADGAIVTAHAGGVLPYQFKWSNNTTSADLSGLVAGQYQLTLTDANGCTELLPVEVPEFGKIPQLSAITDDITCAHPVADIGVTSDQNGLQYVWSGPGGSLPNQSLQSVSVGGLYQVTASNAFGCEAAAQVQVMEDKAVPIAEVGPSTLKVLCDETTVVLSAAGSSQGAAFSNRWTSPALDTSAIDIPIHTPGLYVHTVLNTANGCQAQDSVLVDWDEPIQALFTVDSIRCFGDGNGVIHINNISGGTAPYFYAIDDQHFTTNNTFKNLGPGIYPVHVRDDFGCSWETTIELREPEALSVELTANDTVLELGQPLQLTAVASPANSVWQSILWGPADLPFVPMSLRQQVKPETHTEFTVQVVDQNGCVAEDRLLVAVYNHHIYVPNVIYPGTEENGGFTLFGGDGVLEMRLLRVYDRWGSLLFERRGFPLNDTSLGWDGSFQGQPVNPGVFVWYAEVLLQDGRVLLFKGDVTVVR